ncbi:MAG: polyketide synthase, partial [Elusimicrobiota bacterium]
LRLRQFDMAVTGGVDQMMTPPSYVKFCKIGALSPDGSRPFDAGANGFVMGEGSGVLILKRLSDALRDGDRVYALIRAVGASSDGRGKGITAPNPKGQRLAVERTFSQVGYGPDSVGLLEAHGTSTKVGDVVEAQTAAEVFKGAAARSIGLGSVKSQIGHLKAAAGVASLIKATLALHHKKLPPTINFKTPNPGIDWDKSPFSVITELREWESKGPRRANVSAFGFGGTNFHVALEEATPETTSWTPSFTQEAAEASLGSQAAVIASMDPSLGGETFFFRGDSPSAVYDAVAAFRAGAPKSGPLTAAAFRVNSRARGAYALNLAAETAAKLGDKLDFLLKSRDASVWEKTPPAFKPKSIHPARTPPKSPNVAFMFP